TDPCSTRNRISASTIRTRRPHPEPSCRSGPAPAAPTRSGRCLSASNDGPGSRAELRAGAARVKAGKPKLVLQETEGQVHCPLGETVKPQLFPLPFGLAFITYWLGQVALTLKVEYTTAGETMFTVTVQVLEPVTATLRLYQLLPFDPADSVAVQ